MSERLAGLLVLVVGVALLVFGGIAEAHGWMHPVQRHFAEVLGGGAAVLAVFTILEGP